MNTEPRIDIIGALLADTSRMRILCALMDGRAFTNKELACAANITAQTASAHLKRLEGAGLTRSLRSGRNVYHCITSEKIANALETLACLSPTEHLSRAKGRHLPDIETMRARCCYNHIAGRLGVLMTERLLEMNILNLHEGAVKLSSKAKSFFAELEIDALPLVNTKRPAVKLCLDWTERKHHISGPLATEIMSMLLKQKWVERSSHNRALKITEHGYFALENNFNITRRCIESGT